MRWAGALLIFLAFAGFGAAFALAKKRRIDALRGMCAALELMNGELSARLTPLPELCGLLAGRASGAAGEFLGLLAASLPGLGERDFSALWREAAERSLGSLSGAELSEITRLGDIVGRYELAEQTRALELCLAELRNCLRAAQSAYPGEKKLGFGLAAAAGALLVVVLL